MPSVIDYILNSTNQQRIDYIGHSQGGTSLLVALSLKPEYNSKIRLASLLAPASFVSRVPQILYQLLSRIGLFPIQVRNYFFNEILSNCFLLQQMEFKSFLIVNVDARN